jgi:hypothetical protein
VIIKNLRVQQGGSVLPLSPNPRLDKQLGTRHRAAIGITEETDAVSVVVSEERGEISLCFNGNIARDLDASTLRKALLGLFHKQKDESRRVEAEATAAAAAAAAISQLAQPEEASAAPVPQPPKLPPEAEATEGGTVEDEWPGQRKAPRPGTEVG